MTQTIHPIARGARARLTADTPPGWHEPARKGFTFVVEEFQPALKADDPNFGDDGYIQGDFYYGNADGGFNNVCVPAELVELVTSAEDMAARRIPNITQATRLVVDGLMSTSGEGAEFFEAGPEGEEGGEFAVAYGRTDDGLPFGMKVAVVEVWETDD